MTSACLLCHPSTKDIALQHQREGGCHEQPVFIPVAQSQRVSKAHEILLWKEAAPPPPAFVKHTAAQGEILKYPSVVMQGTANPWCC